jgi:2-polyprenyl-3-methyl-5-hydroxy-6-metoxy-1,4-benzoquinol methylase
MNIEEYHKMHALESTYWWFRARRRMILTIVADVVQQHFAQRVGALRLVDVGCGTGMLMQDLQRYGTVTGLDFAPVALGYCRERGLANLVRANVEQIPLRSESVDFVTALDLIEHVHDDHALTAEIWRILRPGGIALMTVPAHPVLWSAHDVALQHKRRYEKPAFRALVTGAGFELLRYSYMMMLIYPAAAGFRLVKRFAVQREAPPHTDEFPLPRWVNATLRTMVGAEAALLRRWNLPCGLSLMAVARKPGQRATHP